MVEYWRQRCAEKHEELDRCKEERELYAKQQAIAFIKDSILKDILHATTDETVAVDGLGVYYLGFDKAVSNRYDQFIEKQNQNP